MGVEGNRVKDCIIQTLNNSNYDQLDKHAKSIVRYIFSTKSENWLHGSKIICSDKGQEKPDIGIKIKGEEKLISIKSGNSNSIHQETIEKFSKYLLKKDVSKQIINNFIHFATATDPSSGQRYTAAQYKKKYPEVTSSLIIAFNKIRKELIDRFLISGKETNKLKADFLYYHITSDHGHITRMEYALNWLLKQKNRKGAVPIGRFNFQAWGRAMKGQALRKEGGTSNVGSIQIKWSDIGKDILKINNEQK